MRVDKAIKLLSKFESSDRIFIQDDDGTYSEAISVELIPISRQETVIGGDYRHDKDGAYTVVFIGE